MAAKSNTAVDACAAGRARMRDTIQFSLGQGATIVLNKSLPAITDTSGLTVFSGTMAKIIVSGNSKVGALVERKGAKLDLRNLTVADGFANGNPAETSKIRTNPRLDTGSLQDNGGSRRTIVLRTTSPAINFIPKGTNSCGAITSMDQRGVHRPQARRCDAGA